MNSSYWSHPAKSAENSGWKLLLETVGPLCDRDDSASYTTGPVSVSMWGHFQHLHQGLAMWISFNGHATVLDHVVCSHVAKVCTAFIPATALTDSAVAHIHSGF